MKLSASKSRGQGLPELGHHSAANAKLQSLADHLEGRWDPNGYTIGDAVLDCHSQLGVQIMEALRLRTAPLTVNAWQRVPGRTEAEVLDMLRQSDSPPVGE